MSDMKIVLLHYRWFEGDGPERYCFNIKRVLEQDGHSVIPFSVKNSRNQPSEFDRFFLESIDDEVHFGDNTPASRSPRKALASIQRMYWSHEARLKFAALLDEVRPDLVYALQYHNKISPSFLKEARRRGVPVVHRISDFQYMCPNATFFTQGHICEDCLNGHAWSCVRNRCVHNSLAMSVLKLGAKKFHDAIRTTDLIDAFVVPSSFTLSKLAQFGIPTSRLHHIPTFYGGTPHTPAAYEPFFLFIGRITEQKGVRTLVEAFADTNMPLKIIGTSTDGLHHQLQQSLLGRNHHIEFLGFKPFEEIVPYLERCRATIVPSEWYDNFPNSILESFAYAKPVIASRLGSMLETVEHGQTGLTFTPGDSMGLRTMAMSLLEDEAKARRLGAEAATRVESRYSPQTHFRQLMTLFQSLVKEASAGG